MKSGNSIASTMKESMMRVVVCWIPSEKKHDHQEKLHWECNSHNSFEPTIDWFVVLGEIFVVVIIVIHMIIGLGSSAKSEKQQEREIKKGAKLMRGIRYARQKWMICRSVPIVWGLLWDLNPQ